MVMFRTATLLALGAIGQAKKHNIEKREADLTDFLSVLNVDDKSKHDKNSGFKDIGGGGNPMMGGLAANMMGAMHSFGSGVTDSQKVKFQTMGPVQNQMCGVPYHKPNPLMDAIPGRKRRDVSDPRDGPPGLRIVGGTNAAPHSWPWLVWVETLGGPFYSASCGGTLLSPQWVLTAAHCAFNESTGFVRIGAHTKGDDIMSGLAEDIEIEKIIQHPFYNKPQTFAHDFALLKLAKPVNLASFPTGNVGTACLPGDNTCMPGGTECVVAGWGLTHELVNAAAKTLQEVKVKIIPHKVCSGGFYNRGYIHKRSMFCAGYAEGMRDSCAGDSGGPLVCRVPNTDDAWMLYGVVSWGQGCGRAERPGVYGRVTKILPWITTVTGVESQFNANSDLDCGNDYPEGHPDAPKELTEEEAESAAAMNAVAFPPPVPGFIQAFNVSANPECYFEGGDKGTFATRANIPGFKPKYKDGKTCLWMFVNGENAKELANTGVHPRATFQLDFAEFLAKSRRTRCGRADFIRISDGNGKLLVHNLCSLGKKQTGRKITGAAPIYVQMFTKQDGRVGRGLNAQYWLARGENECGMQNEYTVTADSETYIRTPQWGNRRGRLWPDRECSVTIRAPRSHWVECDTGFRSGGYAVKKSHNCKDSYLAFVDGDDADAGNPVRSHVCGVKRQHNVIRSSNSAMTIILKTGEGMQPMGFTGFNVRCHAIKWGAWFGAAEKSLGRIEDVDYDNFDGDDQPGVRSVMSNIESHAGVDLEQEMTEAEARAFAIDDAGF